MGRVRTRELEKKKKLKGWEQKLSQQNQPNKGKRRDEET